MADSGAKLVVETSGIQMETFDISTYRGGTAGEIGRLCLEAKH